MDCRGHAFAVRVESPLGCVIILLVPRCLSTYINLCIIYFTGANLFHVGGLKLHVGNEPTRINRMYTKKAMNSQLATPAEPWYEKFDCLKTIQSLDRE